jgi:hypothetical protein
MDFEGFLETLDEIVKDKKLGIINTTSPLRLLPEEFINLINSGCSYDFRLNQKLKSKTPYYYHTAKYKGVEFLTHGEKEITNEFGGIQPI